MTAQWKQLLVGLEQNPGRADLVSGVVCLCRTLQNSTEQAELLSDCCRLILGSQPVVGLKLLRLALLLAPRDVTALKMAREIFKRRGRWAAEQRVNEFLATLNATTATSLPPPELSRSVVADQFPKSDVADSAVAGTVVRNPDQLASRQPEALTAAQPQFVETPLEVVHVNEIPSSEKHAVQVAADVEGHSDAVSPDRKEKAVDLFDEFLSACEFEKEFRQFSAGLAANCSGLVVFVNLLQTMQLIGENQRSNALVVLYRIIKERDDHSGAEDLFDRFFMNRTSRGND